MQGGGYIVDCEGFILYLHEENNTDGLERKRTLCDLRDYKFFCFHGRPAYCQVISDRSTEEKIDFFDMEWKHQEFTGLALPKNPFYNISIPIPIPKTFELMKASAEMLSKGMKFIRIDFYEVNQKMYFGELTFYPASGFGEFSPSGWNITLGDLLELNKE